MDIILDLGGVVTIKKLGGVGGGGLGANDVFEKASQTPQPPPPYS